MTEFSLYREPTVLDTVQHRQLRLRPIRDHSAASGMHAAYLAAVEFPAAAREYVIMFVRDPLPDGSTRVAPVVILGVTPGENLHVSGERWDAQYVPAYVRRYPFWTLRDASRPSPTLVFDAWWHGFSQTEGDPLFEADGTPAPKLTEVLQFVDHFEQEVQRTDAFCAYLDALGLFQEMQADVTLPDGSTQTLNDFLSIDDAKFQALPDAAVLELFRSGMMGLVHAQRLSATNMQALVERKARRMQPATR